MTMVETGDGAVRINATLLWTVLSALALLVFWGGTTIANLQGGQAATQASIAEVKGLIISQQVAVRDLEARVRVGEGSAVRSEARFESLTSSLNELKSGQRDIVEILRREAKP